MVFGKHINKYYLKYSWVLIIGIIALLGGQILVERVFNFSSTVSIIINFIGGIYFIYLLLKEARA